MVGSLHGCSEVKLGGEPGKRTRPAETRRRQSGPGGACRAISRDAFLDGSSRHKQGGEQEQTLGYLHPLCGAACIRASLPEMRGLTLSPGRQLLSADLSLARRVRERAGRSVE